MDMRNRKLPPPQTFWSDAHRSAWQRNKIEECNLSKIMDHIYTERHVTERYYEKESVICRTRSARFCEMAECRKKTLETQLNKLVTNSESEDTKNSNNNSQNVSAKSEKPTVVPKNTTLNLTTNQVLNSVIKYNSPQRTTNGDKGFKNKAATDDFNPSDSDDDVFDDFSDQLSEHDDVTKDADDQTKTGHSSDNMAPVTVSNNGTGNGMKLYRSRFSCRAANLAKLRQDLKKMQESRNEVKKVAPSIEFYISKEMGYYKQVQHKISSFCKNLKKIEIERQRMERLSFLT
jgi:hypothetical protein